MSSLVFLLCLLCVVRSMDLRSSQRGVREDDFMIEELFRTNNNMDEWKEKSDKTYDTSDFRLPRLWNTVRDMTTHLNPCQFKIKEWQTAAYLKQKQYDFQPDRITVKHCLGSSNDVVKQGCRNVMDCVTQYERRRFIRKPKGAACTQWHVYEKEIPVGCECMMAT